jgi:hypothetical protein
LRAIGGNVPDVVEWNDRPGRTFEEVRAKFIEAIALA